MFLSNKPRFLMCPPTFYRVNYSINPWMEPDSWHKKLYVDAQEQWGNLLSKIVELKAEVELVTPHPDLPDMVFTANAGAIQRDNDKPHIRIAFFRHKERRKESALFGKKFTQLGIPTMGYMEPDYFETNNCFSVPPRPEVDYYFEGAGDHLYDPYRNITWKGHGFRSAKEENYYEHNSISLELVDPKYYHLDTCFCPLTDGEVMFYPEAFSKESLEKIFQHVKYKHRIIVSIDDAKKFACNAVVLGENIILSGCSNELGNRLFDLSYKVHRVPLTAFHKAGGSAACLTFRLPEITREQ